MGEKFDVKHYREMLEKAQPNSDEYVEQYLFDLAQDPIEANNLADNPDYEFVRRELAQKLKAHMVKAGEKEPEIYPYGHIFY